MSTTDVTRETFDEVVIYDHRVPTISVGYEIGKKKENVLFF